jgi:Ni,Fe-hydrogenase I small subunit
MGLIAGAAAANPVAAAALGQAANYTSVEATSEKPAQLSCYFKMCKAIPTIKEVADCPATSENGEVDTYNVIITVKSPPVTGPPAGGLDRCEGKRPERDAYRRITRRAVMTARFPMPAPTSGA